MSSGDRSSSEPPRGGLDDTIPASEPPTDIDGRPMRNSIPPFQRYRMGAELGRGGMGRVVEAFDTVLGRTVALKEVLPKGSGVAKRFQREVQITARLEHPAIIPLYDSGTTPDGRPFYVMRRVTGRPLDEMIKRAPALADRLVLLPAMLAAIDAIAHAHARGIIHRDLKPANILVGELGETVVIDWGLAKVVDEDDPNELDPTKLPIAGDSLHTQAGSVFGTPGFMAPEQARGEALGTHADVYALGATLYQLLAGAPPHAGTSATEVLGKTLKHDVEPLEDAAPGAPPELVAIVEKALSFEPETRYPNAGALGEDVRRFLAGQLVAAHRYTPRQRINRFAKRHRAALIIAAGAAVALAVLAWVSVSRVLTERDAATDARRQAEVDKRAAELARDRLVERNDALTVTQARALLEVNPTAAIATLKQLDPTSERLGEAKAVAQAAVMRGVWTSIRSVDSNTIVAELDPEGKLLVQVTLEGRTDAMVRVWDLERRRLVTSRPYTRGYRALWLANRKLLVYSESEVPELFDPMTNVVTPTTLPPLRHVRANLAGTRALVVDKAKRALLYDVETRTAKPVWEGHEVTAADLAPDGSWLAVAEKGHLVILDTQTGAEMGSYTGTISRIAASDHRQLALLDGLKLRVATVGPPAVWTEVDVTPTMGKGVIDIAFRGDELNMYVSNGDVLAFKNVLYTTQTAVRGFTANLVEAGDHVMIVPSAEGKLHLSGDQLQIAVRLPGPLAMMRVAARTGVSRIAVVGPGQIYTLDLDTVTPRRFTGLLMPEIVFADDDTLLAMQTSQSIWQWIDLRTRKLTPFKYDPRGIPMISDVDPMTGRVLIREVMGPTSRLVVLTKYDTKMRVIGTGPDAWGRLIPGNAVVFGGSDGRVFAKVGDKDPEEIVKLDGKAVAAVGLGQLMYAVVSDGGELVRGNLANGAIERTRVSPGGRVFLAADLLGRTLIAEDNRLSVWDRDRVIELQKYDRNIAQVAPTELGVIVTLVDHEMQLLDPKGDKPAWRTFVSSTRTPWTQSAGRIVVGTGIAQQLNVLELPSLAHWDVPILFLGSGAFALAPNARRVVQGAYQQLMVWDLPQAGADFPAWLDEQTNALIQDDQIAWPWQVSSRP